MDWIIHTFINVKCNSEISFGNSTQLVDAATGVVEIDIFRTESFMDCNE